jgi:large subunit ribosomal protein L25
VFGATVNPRDIELILHSQAGENTILDLRLKGKGSQRQAMIKDYQVDPITGKVVHADFVRIEMDTQIEVSVPMRTMGTAVGVKDQGGLLEVVHRELEVGCLPADIPEHIDFDVSALMIGDHVRLSDIKAVGNYRFLDAPDTVVVTVVTPRIEEAPVAVDAAEATAEPEVIAKGKKDEDEGGADKPEGKAGKPEGKGKA